MKSLRWCAAALAFAAFYLREIVASNLRVARDVLSPRPPLSPGIVRLPIDGLTDRQALAYATLLTMTPGTLTLEIEPASGSLYLHTLYAEPSPDALRAHLRQHYELPLRRLL
jgi:multicomponent Na+:H+ antiporter subunit E